ncbi:MAG: adenylyl-sulfate kinase [Thermodesulfovibrionia bacterium]|nr:adenylyl-sulfate kinase [Thermodesulfovibrionia bacterium]
MNKKTKDIYWHEPSVRVEDRWISNGYKSCLLWLTGLSGSGKSTIAHALDRRLHMLEIHSYVLDGDNVRYGLNKDLGLSPEDRKENIRRIGEASKLFIDAGLIVLAAFIAPYSEDRKKLRELLKKEQFVEVYVKCSIEDCEKRDPKGLYRKARAGEIEGFTGISAPYEEPENPNIVLETDKMSLDNCVETLMKYLIQKDYITKRFYYSP